MSEHASYDDMLRPRKRHCRNDAGYQKRNTPPTKGPCEVMRRKLLSLTQRYREYL